MSETVIRIPTLETERLTLRAPRLADFEAFAAMEASPRMEPVGGPFDRRFAFTQLAALIGHWLLRGFGRWAVVERASGRFMGIVGLYHPEGWPEPEVAWTLADAAEGKGIAFEAALAARAYGYGALRLPALASLVDPANTRSNALARRMGCVEEGFFDHADHGRLTVWRHPGPEALA